MEKEIEDINATLTPSFLNRRHAQHSNQLGVCPRVPLLPAPQRAGADWHQAQRKEEMMPVSAFSVLINQDAIFIQNDMATLLACLLANWLQISKGSFVQKVRWHFKNQISTCLYVFKHVKSLGCTQIELLGILSLPLAAKLITFKNINEDRSYCHPLPQQP